MSLWKDGCECDPSCKCTTGLQTLSHWVLFIMSARYNNIYTFALWAYWGCQCRINLARPCCLLWMPVSDLQTENSVYSGSACSRKESHEKVRLKASDHNREPWRLKPWWETGVDKAEMCYPLVSGRVSNVFTQERVCRKDMYADLPQRINAIRSIFPKPHHKGHHRLDRNKAWREKNWRAWCRFFLFCFLFYFLDFYWPTSSWSFERLLQDWVHKRKEKKKTWTRNANWITFPFMGGSYFVNTDVHLTTPLSRALESWLFMGGAGGNVCFFLFSHWPQKAVQSLGRLF